MRADTKIIFEMFDTEGKAASVLSCSQSRTDVLTLKNENPDQSLYATTEPGGFFLDGSYKILSELPTGLYSDEMSAADGSFLQSVVLRVAFARPVTSSGITLYFPLEEYPTTVNIQWLDGENVLNEAQYSPDSELFFCKGNVEQFTALQLTFYGTKTPRHYLKLCGIDYGQALRFGSDKIIKSNVVQDISLLCDEIAVNTLEFTVSDKERLFSVVSEDSIFFAAQENQKISVFTTVENEQKKVGTFYLKSITGSGITAKFTAQDSIGVLEGEGEVGDSYYDTDFESFCGQILGGYKYIIDDSLKRAQVKGYLKSCSRREALQQACFAVGAVVSTQGGEEIKIHPLTAAPSHLVTASQIFAGGKVESIKPYKALCLTVHSFDSDGTDTETIISYPLNDKGKGKVQITDAVFVNAGNADAVVQRLAGYYGHNVLYKFSMPLNRLYTMGDVLINYLDKSYIKGSLTEFDINLTGGMVAHLTVRGNAFPTDSAVYSGEIYLGERGVV